ncbi:MAG: phenylalanine--tRNA ligase subunit alpha [Deltaproteobacteria bacterium]|nr:phenylalanine--tRNA ligase subunit alpha [Deltaproteobacteria bacterium]MBZ0219823.1 phenylalanine--tRNA ligase subunit alpha [Deltaproteobacteria bacterium]
MSRRVEDLEREALDELSRASSEREALREARNRYLGRKGEVAELLKGLGSLPPEERKKAGEAINNLKTRLEEAFDKALSSLDESEKRERLEKERVDITLPGRFIRPGKLHPVTQITDEIEDIFTGLGFDIAEGPEVELDYYNFEALNFPKDHPARDMQDTFFVSDEVVLRTHTSPVQIRVMEKCRPPLRVIAPGTVYRRDSDLTHSPMFHQIEGFMVDRDISFANLKAVLTLFLERLFGQTAVRFRPSFFPFVEPGAEVDIRCVICGGNGCRVCKGTGWLEILGAGMIHPNVFRAVGYDPEEYTGFAFGLGVERVAMLKFGIGDLRLLFENDMRFLEQF